jgi:hypothetical protein
MAVLDLKDVVLGGTAAAPLLAADLFEDIPLQPFFFAFGHFDLLQQQLPGMDAVLGLRTLLLALYLDTGRLVTQPYARGNLVHVLAPGPLGAHELLRHIPRPHPGPGHQQFQFIAARTRSALAPLAHPTHPFPSPGCMSCFLIRSSRSMDPSSTVLGRLTYEVQ